MKEFTPKKCQFATLSETSHQSKFWGNVSSDELKQNFSCREVYESSSMSILKPDLSTIKAFIVLIYAGYLKPKICKKIRVWSFPQKS